MLTYLQISVSEYDSLAQVPGVAREILKFNRRKNSIFETNSNFLAFLSPGCQ